MAFYWAEDERPVPGRAGQGVREEVVKGWSSSHSVWCPQCCSRKLLCVRHASISTGTHILGLPRVSWVFGPQVHPLECRTLNLLLSLHPSDLHCPRSPALALIGTWSVLSCNPSIALERRIKAVSCCWRLACRDCVTTSWQRSSAELCVGQRHSVLWIGSS